MDLACVIKTWMDKERRITLSLQSDFLQFWDRKDSMTVVRTVVLARSSSPGTDKYEAIFVKLNQRDKLTVQLLYCPSCMVAPIPEIVNLIQGWLCNLKNGLF